MKLKCLATGSTGNSYILTSDSGKHLILESGIPIADIKRGLDFEVEDIQGCIVSHEHADHSLSVNKLHNMGIKTHTPYLDIEHKRLRTTIGDFKIDSFPVPHNNIENRGFIITVDGQKICFLIDLEYCPYNLSEQGINVLICECNYISDLVPDDLPNLHHKVIGHCELNTTIGIINNCQKHLRKVILTHMSNGETFNKEIAMQRIKDQIPKYIDVEYATPNKIINLSEIPF